jgi:hypothetical protein
MPPPVASQGVSWQPPPPPPAHPQTASGFGANEVSLAGGAAALGLILGAIGPWAKVLVVSKAGIEGDGILTIILGGILGAVLIAARYDGQTPSFLALLGTGLLVLAVAGYDIVSLLSTGDDTMFTVQVGWGLWLTALAGVALVLLAIPAFAVRRR